MEMEVAGLTGAAYGEKSPERHVERNDYRDRTWRLAELLCALFRVLVFSFREPAIA